uniref:Protein phosphatase 1 regulatory subunit 21 n=1 Tax=Parastrongyloides trichosuri TaxID=131310 RepID=A0A0N4ZSQ6_PARTI
MSETSSPNRISPEFSDSIQFSYSPSMSLPENISPVEENRLLQTIPCLKQALLEERSKFEYISNSLIKSDEERRFLAAENESLAFRNEQLLKKVESLQESLKETKKIIDEKKKTFKLGLFGKNKKKNLMTNKNDDNVSLDPSLLEEELSFRVNENENLQRKIDILENEIENSQKLTNDRIKVLETKNQSLEKNLNECLKEKEILKMKLKCFNNERNSSDNIRPKISIEKESSSSNNTFDSPLILEVIEGTDTTDSEESFEKKDFGEILKLSKNVTELYQHFFILLNNRTSIYPRDSQLEKLTPSLTNLSTILKDIINNFEKWNMLSNSFKDVNDFVEANIHDTIFESLKKLFLELGPSLKDCINEENKENYCTPNLQRHNENFVERTNELLNIIIQQSTITSLFNCDNKSTKLLSFLDGIKTSTKQISDEFVNKILIENRLPTANKKLKTINDDISKILIGIVDHLTKLEIHIVNRKKCINILPSPIQPLTKKNKAEEDDDNCIDNIDDDINNENEEFSKSIQNLKAIIYKLQVENSILKRKIPFNNDNFDFKQIDLMYIQKFKEIIRKSEYFKSCTRFYKNKVNLKYLDRAVFVA